MRSASGIARIVVWMGAFAAIEAAIAQPIVLGQIVRPKSGGTEMTVSAVKGPEADVQTLWFSDGQLQNGSFARAALEVVKPSARDRTFRIGDVVRLRSGGPEMTVVALRGDVGTLWSADGKQQNGRFPTIALELVAN